MGFQLAPFDHSAIITLGGRRQRGERFGDRSHSISLLLIPRKLKQQIIKKIRTKVRDDFFREIQTSEIFLQSIIVANSMKRVLRCHSPPKKTVPKINPEEGSEAFAQKQLQIASCKLATYFGESRCVNTCEHAPFEKKASIGLSPPCYYEVCTLPFFLGWLTGQKTEWQRRRRRRRSLLIPVLRRRG